MDWVNAFSVGPCIVSFYAGFSGVPDYSSPAWSGSMSAGDSQDISYNDIAFTITISSAGNVALTSDVDVTYAGYELMVDVEPIAAHTSTRVANVITAWYGGGGGGSSVFNPLNSPVVGYGASVAGSDPPFADGIILTQAGSGDTYTPNPTDDLGAPAHVAVYVGMYGS